MIISRECLTNASVSAIDGVCMYQSQNRKGRDILPSLSYHSNENNRQRYHNCILNMEDNIHKSVTYGGHVCAREILNKLRIKQTIT